MEALAYEEMAAVQDTHWWFAARRDVLRAQLQRMALPANTSILEVGSGTGANLDLLAQFGSVTGLEMCREAISFANRCTSVMQGRARLVQGRCPEDLPRLAQRFDLVGLFDVLEHLDDDVDSLRTVAKLLQPGGKIILTVPAYPWLWSAHDEQLHHRRRYTRRSLSAALRQAGLRAEVLSHFNTLLFPLALAERVYERLTGSNHLSTRVPVAPLNGTLQYIFASERRLIRHVSLPFGLSLLAVATLE